MIYYCSADYFSCLLKVIDETAAIQEDEVSAVTSTSVASNEIDIEHLPSFPSKAESLPSSSRLSSAGLEGGNLVGAKEDVSLATLLGLVDNDAEDDEEQSGIAAGTEAVLDVYSSSVAPLTAGKSSRKSSISVAPLIGSKSCRKSTTKKVKPVACTKVAIPINAERNKGRAARRVKVGANDIFSDDEDVNEQLVKGTSASMQVLSSSCKRERTPLVKVTDDSEIGVVIPSEITDVIAGTTDRSDIPLEETIVPRTKKQRSTLRKTAVSFSIDEIDHVTDAFESTGLQSGSRHSRRLSGAGSAKKTQTKRKGTPRALPSDRPRFSRPSQNENEGAMETEDEEISASGYGTYFSSMMEIQQVLRCMDQ
jgi:hypothetical protein